MGGAPSEFQDCECFKRGIDNPEITVVSTWNGAMTQETMVAYAKHLEARGLPEKERWNLKIMYLNDHASWSLLEHTLWYLVLLGRLFPFFFVSRCPIWCQP
jgi:hypothetical protein